MPAKEVCKKKYIFYDAKREHFMVIPLNGFT